MENIFRKGRHSDLPKLNQISLVSKGHWGYPDEWMERWKEELQLAEKDLERMQVLVLETDNEVKGFCAVMEHDQYCEIEHLWILPTEMGKGLGGKLLLVTIKEFVPNDLDLIVTADPNAESFYKKYGFNTFDKVESFPKGRYLPVMRKRGSKAEE